MTGNFWLVVPFTPSEFVKAIIPWTEEKMPGAMLCSASYFIPITKKSFREIYKYTLFFFLLILEVLSL